MPPDRFRPTNGHTRFLAGAGRHGLPFALALGLGACGTTPPPSAVPAPTTPPLSTGAPERVCAAPAVPTVDSPPAPQTGLCTSTAAESDTLASLLVYTERLRSMNAAEVAGEIAALADPGASAPRQMQLALALMHTHQAVDTARALGLLQRVVNQNSPESTPLKPLARLLAARLQDLRRLEDTVERQGQHLRDSQRRIEQLNERLEAMRAIERSLTTRPPPPPPGSRPAAP
ncbi:hypothetical protein KIH07_08500 [Hydrogenophaga taeniospiralis]|uniref:hypothetical protein n=1 Tax=Hydrogenophaga taeniospiralis TaxID=65656 RepID=UPI001CF9A556|nr:hypothetical protein [Hydrogenophaga taeniospiralis]MCB4363772.1 hypothetical protein [Hydrogenophaga taeniospiralis]